MRRIDTPDGPIHVGDTAPTWDERKPAPRRRRWTNLAITAAIAAVTLALLAATVWPMVRSAL